MKRTQQKQKENCSSNSKGKADAGNMYNVTNPLAIGNLFQSSWNVCNPKIKNSLNTQLLKYYIENGYGNLDECCGDEKEIRSEDVTVEKMEIDVEDADPSANPSLDETCNSTPTNSGSRNKSAILSKVMYESAMRGDIHGMNFMATHRYSSFDQENICTMAGAAGQLTALMWLRGDIHVDGCEDLRDKRKCPWDPTEVHREAAENAHYDVVEYVERNSEGFKIQVHYGVGLPW